MQHQDLLVIWPWLLSCSPDPLWLGPSAPRSKAMGPRGGIIVSGHRGRISCSSISPSWGNCNNPRGALQITPGADFVLILYFLQSSFSFCFSILLSFCESPSRDDKTGRNQENVKSEIIPGRALSQIYHLIIALLGFLNTFSGIK